MAATLAACSLAPGMYVGRGDDASDEPAVGWLSAKPRPAMPGAGTGQGAATASLDAADAPPPGGLIAINSDLIRKLRNQKSPELGADVQALLSGQPGPYLIGASDALNIVVWDHPELSAAQAATPATGSTSAGAMGYVVSPEGLIQFPYAGALKVAGLTELQARDVLVKRLAKYIKDPQVTLRVQAYRAGRIYMDGEVRTPGLQALDDIPMTLPEAIGRAGGLTPAADRSAVAITRQGKTTVVNMTALSARGINPARLLLQNGDLVRVISREESKVYVLGEVLRPNTQNLRDGRLSLGEALTVSGGVNPTTADPRQIFVVRAANAPQPEIYHLDARSPAAYALAQGFELRSQDVIYVDPVPLVRWNRVISLILPSAQAVSTGRNALN